MQHSPALSLTASSRQPEVPYSSGSILVVEDEAPVRRLIVRVLTRHGYRVEAAGSAQEAASIVEANQYRPDLLLTDVVLPGGENGREVADYMLALFPELPVIFMSGYTRDAVVHDGRINDNVAFLEKPFKREQFLTVLARLQRFHQMGQKIDRLEREAKETKRTRSPCRMGWPTGRPVATSQTRTVLSSDPVTTHRPVGLNAAALVNERYR